MRLLLIYLFYYLGDFISKTSMQWFNGLGYSLYSKLMLWSSDLDTEDILWKSPKDNNYE